MNVNMANGNVRYREIVEILRDEILQGRYNPSRVFPSVTRLTRRFGISHLTAVRVLEQLKSAGLVVSRQGSGSFVTRRSMLIGLIVPGLAYGEFYPPVVSEIARLCQSFGYGLMFGDAFSNDSTRREKQLSDLAKDFVDKDVCGVIFNPADMTKTAAGVNAEIIDRFSKAGIPVVLLDSDIVTPPERSGCDLVGSDNFEAGFRIARHLLDRGARRIAFVTYADCTATSVYRRMQGVRACVTGRSAPSVLLPDISVPFPHPIDVRHLKNYVRRHRPDALICASDTGAAFLCKALIKIGCRVPEDVMVAGFDDVQHALISSPQLTTAHQPCADIAAMAFRLLVDRIREPTLPTHEIALDAPLVIRESTDRTGGPSHVKRTKAKVVK